MSETKDLVYSKTPEAIIEGKEESINLINAIYELKDQYREIIFLRSFGELSFREIGSSFKQSEGWARTNFYRAKLKLKNLLINSKEDL